MTTPEHTILTYTNLSSNISSPDPTFPVWTHTYMCVRTHSHRLLTHTQTYTHTRACTHARTHAHTHTFISSAFLFGSAYLLTKPEMEHTVSNYYFLVTLYSLFLLSPPPPHPHPSTTTITFQASIVWAIPWSLAGQTDIEGRKKFDSFYRELLLGKKSEYPIPESITKVEVIYPQENSTYDYLYEVIM